MHTFFAENRVDDYVAEMMADGGRMTAQVWPDPQRRTRKHRY
jgi:hypothetical protein